MHKKFDIVDRAITLSDRPDNTIDIYVNPDETEKQTILKNLDFDEHTLSSSLDADEVSRIEFEQDYTFVIWKRPNNYSHEAQLEFKVSSIGIILSAKKIIIILNEEYELYQRREFSKINSLNDYFLKILFYTIRHFVEHIKAINMMSKELQTKITRSMENKYLIQMFNLSESLVYYIDAINANNTVLTKLKNSAVKIGFTPDEQEVLDDIIIENNQCYKQALIYSNILSGLMDARGSLINNNINLLLRKLTIINIIFLPLNLIAGIGGMSEFTMMTQGIPWQVSYAIFGIAMVVLGWLMAVILNRIGYQSKHTYSRRKNLISRWFSKI